VALGDRLRSKQSPAMIIQETPPKFALLHSGVNNWKLKERVR
jgi:hypothetical protein